MKKIFLAIYLMSFGYQAEGETLLTNPNFSEGTKGWASGWPLEVIPYEEDDLGLTVHDQYIMANYHGSHWNSILSESYEPVFTTTPLYFYIEAGITEQCKSMKLQIRIVSSAGVLNKKVVELKDSTRWFGISSDYVSFPKADYSSVSLQIDFMGTECSGGALLINFAQLGTNLLEMKNTAKGTRLKN